MASTMQENSIAAPAGFTIRLAMVNDVDQMAEVFFKAFHPSHKFWQFLMPRDDVGVQWWRDAWTLGIQQDPSTRTLIAQKNETGDVVAFARWVKPQSDGSVNRLWPALPTQWDSAIAGATFGGMKENRAAVMGQKPHWMLDFIGVDPEQQGHGIGHALVAWGCQKADSEGVEAYLDATPVAKPFYQKWFGFEDRCTTIIPDHDSYGHYELTSVVRLPVSAQ